VASIKEVLLPDIGDFSEVGIIEILVAPGDRVEAEHSLLTLESDKATMEIPAPFPGTVTELKVRVGDKVSTGSLLLLMDVGDGGVHTAGDIEATADLPLATAEEVEDRQGPAPAANRPPAEEEAPPRLPGEKARTAPPVLAKPSDRPGSKPHASPAVRRFARELGVDLTLVSGSGPKGRILREDIQGFVKRALQQGMAAAPAAAGPFQLPAMPEVDFSRFGEVETRPLPRIRKLSGAHLHRCWLGVPHVTQLDAADITELEAFRTAQKATAEREGVRLTLMPFLMKACAAALRAMPSFNSSLTPDGEGLILKKYVHIGVAVDTPNGLVVPVLRDVDQKGIFQLARELGEVSARARDGKLSPADLQGGCFSISSLGGIGGTAFTPIVNAPEVAILGVSRSEMRPVWSGKEFLPRLMLPLSLSYDHRVIDGADGVRFTTLLCRLLGDIRRLLL
jgi:pyruvate dehydrogenase E2 component (dihydrolipoyllysine-residue acetyltransferase)